MIAFAKVSVCMITYGHEKYIEEAINSILNQETNFEFELILANDNSLDRTDEIVQRIIENHKRGSLIKYTKHENNRGMMSNFIWALRQCSGKYIALCEGDDYWVDSFKLQKQFDLLELNEKYSLVFSNFYFEDEITREVRMSEIHAPSTFDTNYLIQIFNIRTCTVLFRRINELFTDFPENLPYGDYPLFLRSSLFGDIVFMEDYTAIYRINLGSITHTIDLKIPEQNRFKILNWFILNNPTHKSAGDYSIAFLTQKLLNRARIDLTIQVSLRKNFIQFLSLYCKTLFFKNRAVKISLVSVIKSLIIVMVNKLLIYKNNYFKS